MDTSTAPRTAPAPSSRRPPPRRAVVAAAAASALVFAACAEDPADQPPAQQPTTDEPAVDPDEVDDDDEDDGPDEADDPADDPTGDPAGDEGDDEAAAASHAGGASAASGVDLDVELMLIEVASLNSATAGAAGPDGTLYLADRGGTVHPLDEGGIGEPVVDLSAQTTTDGERGLLGLAFAADGSELYVSYTDLDGANVVAAVPVGDDGIVDAGAEPRTIYTIAQPRSNHNGGDVQVGPDGLLYLGLGDGGGSGDPDGAGQDLGTALGSLIRIDPAGGDPYAVPDDNPFVDDPDAADEILAYGLRNPWRFSFDRETGDLYLADVGQHEREEINVLTIEQATGANLGWNLMEGTEPFAGEEPEDHVAPVHEYGHGPGCSVTGGYVYRGSNVPELRGAYLFSDLCDGTIRALVVQDGEVVEEGELGVAGGDVVSFAQDADGELYVLDLDGTVSRLDLAES